MPSETPTDRLYRNGVPIQADDIVRGVKLDNPLPSSIQRGVDWNQPIEQDETTEYAAASAASHYHYQNLSNVLLCDKIILDARNVPEPVQNAAKILAERSAQGTAAWGRYMQAQGGGGRINEEQREYYQLLFQEADVLPVLLGIHISTIGPDESRAAFYKHGDPIFYKVADSIVEHSQQTVDPLTHEFRAAIEPLSDDERRRLLQKVGQYVDILQIFTVKRDNDICRPLNAPTEQFLGRASTKLKKFYDDVGLTDNIF